ncbi:MAG: hypothetical protein H0V17_19855 [Deltaproteobacteria bacterium]|nr:hypothetical protein [Deltaproteobacteria bacterium]
MKRAWVFMLLALAECSPNVSFYAIFQLPGEAKIDAAKLHVRGRKKCNRDGTEQASPQPPEPGLEEPYTDSNYRDTITDFQREHDSKVSARFRASRCEIAVTAWYDSNGDNVVNRGDHVATIPTTEITSGGFCLGDKNYQGIIPLKRLD